MAVPEATVHLMAWLAAGSSLCTFLDFDKPTRALCSMFAATMWYIMGFSAYQIRVVDGTPETFSVEPLAYVGFAAGTVMAAWLAYHSFKILTEAGEEARSVQLP